MSIWLKRIGRWLQLLLIVLLSVVGVLLLLLYVTGELGGPLLYQLPANYRGWLAIRYDDAGCPPLRQERWYLVIPVDAKGRGCTSSPPPDGWRYRRFEYIYPHGKREQLAGLHEDVHGGSISGPRRPRIATFFVGSNEELEASPISEYEFRRKLDQSR